MRGALEQIAKGSLLSALLGRSNVAASLQPFKTGALVLMTVVSVMALGFQSVP